MKLELFDDDGNYIPNPSEPMNDLISREEAIKIARETDYIGLDINDVRKVTDEVVKGLKAIPSAEPKVGRWIDTNMTCCGAKVYKCSVCDNEIDEMPTEEGEPIWNYCPNCGVKMERRANENSDMDNSDNRTD